MGPSTASVSGSWNLYHTEKGGTEQGPDFFTITRTGDSISGTAKIGPSVATINGTVSGMNITFSLVFGDGSTTSLTGTISNNGTKMSGTYSNPDASGTWRSVALNSVSVTAINATIVVGTTMQFTAIGTYFDGTSNDVTSNVTWNSSNTSAATINNNGLARGLAQGASTITATSGSISGSTALTVTQPSPSSGLDNWHVRTSGTDSNLVAVTYGNGIFAAVGGDRWFGGLGGGSGIIMTSPDGITWTQRYSGNDVIRGIAYGNGTFVAEVGTVIITSQDGVTWIQRYLSNYELNGVTYCNGTFVAVGGVGSFAYGGAILTSPDGVAWTQRYGGTTDINIRGVTCGNNLFVAVGMTMCSAGFCTSHPIILTSSDALSWTQDVSVSTFDALLAGVSYGDGTFVAVGNTNAREGTILTSPDGVTWTQKYSGSNALSGVTYGNGTFVATGGTILTSTDSSNWTQRNSGTTLSLYGGIAYGNGTFIIVGPNGTILQSDPL